jgi:hypothetical protein
MRAIVSILSAALIVCSTSLYAQFGLVGKDERIENYVTGKALDGLYLMIAEQKRAIRQNPLGAASNIAQKVFGMLR